MLLRFQSVEWRVLTPSFTCASALYLQWQSVTLPSGVTAKSSQSQFLSPYSDLLFWAKLVSVCVLLTKESWEIRRWGKLPFFVFVFCVFCGFGQPRIICCSTELCDYEGRTYDKVWRSHGRRGIRVVRGRGEVAAARDSSRRREGDCFWSFI